MPSSLKRRTIFGAVLAFAILASIATLAIRNTMRLTETDDWVSHTHEVIQLIENARLAVSRTAIADYRERVDGVVPSAQVEQDRLQLRGMIESLKTLTKDNPEQQRRLAQLGLSTAFGQTEISLKLLTEMLSQENALQTSRLRSRDLAAGETSRTLAILAVLGGLVLAGAFALIYVQTQRQLRAEKARAISERFTATIIDKMIAGLITTDARGRIQTVNPAAVAIFGYAPDELIGESIVKLMAMSEDEAAATLRTLPGPALGRVTEWEARRKDGTTFPMELSLFEFMADDGPHLAGNVRDISERREIDRMKTEFVSVVSHELRTPLTSVRGALQIVLEDAPEYKDPEHAPLLQIALKNCERLIRIINDILDVSKIESGQVQLKMDVCDAADIIRSSLEASGEMARAAGVRIIVENPGRPALIRVDPDRFSQVLTNLVSNAIKFSPPGAAVTVTTRLGVRGIGISIRDHGPGIAAGDIPLLFRKFKQLDSSATRARGGSGLGLAISKALIEEHAGTISVESVVGNGSVFTVHVPYAESLERLPTGPFRSGQKRQSASVILAEDDADLREVLAQSLARAGFKVAPASNGKVARTLYDSGQYDALVIDLHMPVADGFGLIEHVRNTAAGKTMPIVVISGSNSGKGETRSMALGATSFLAKPVTTDELVHELYRALEA